MTGETIVKLIGSQKIIVTNLPESVPLEKNLNFLLCPSSSPNENLSSQNSKNLSSNTGKKIKPLKNRSNPDRLKIRIDFTMVLHLSRVLRTMGRFFLRS